MNIEEIVLSIIDVFSFADETIIATVESGEDPDGKFVIVKMTNGHVFEIRVFQKQ